MTKVELDECLAYLKNQYEIRKQEIWARYICDRDEVLRLYKDEPTGPGNRFERAHAAAWRKLARADEENLSNKQKKERAAWKEFKRSPLLSE